MTRDPKATDPVRTLSTDEHATCPGRARESKAERILRYEAQIIAEREGISIEPAREIARHKAAVEESAAREHKSREAKKKKLKRERRHDLSKRDTIPIVETRGPAMQGGAPGSGKKR